MRRSGPAVHALIETVRWCRVRRTIGAACAVLLAVPLAGAAGLNGSSADASGRLRPSSASSLRPAATAAAITQPTVNVAVYDACRSEGAPIGLVEPASAYIAGYANASKENGAVPVGFPSLALGDSQTPEEGLGGTPAVTVGGDTYSCTDVNLQLDYDGQAELPPTTATLLAFGFTPVTATVHLMETGAVPVRTIVYEDSSGSGASHVQFTAVSTVTMAVQLTDVTVDGTALDVGSHCTAGPLSTPDLDAELGLPDTVVLTGGDAHGEPLPQYGMAQNGGALAGTVTIPPFTGCVTPAGENLDPLLTAAVSGPGNYLKVIQAPLCLNTGAGDLNCTAQDLPEFEPLWTVHGGSYSGTGQVQFTQITGIGKTKVSTAITCAGSSVSGDVPNLKGPLRDEDLGTMAWATTTCTGTSTSTTASTWTLQQQGPAYLDGKLPSAGTEMGNVDDLSLVLTQTQGSEPGCTATIAGVPNATIAFPATISVVGPEMLITSSTCTEFSVTGGPGGETAVDRPASMTVNYALAPSKITIDSP